MSTQPICPCCHSPQAIQRVAAIVTGGTQQVHVISADLMPAAGVAQTNLAQLLAPPRRPGGSGWLIIILSLGLLLFCIPLSCLITTIALSIAGQGFDLAFTTGAAERVFAVVVGSAVLGSTALIIHIARLRERGLQADVEHWNRQLAHWQQSWYCHRCHVAFVAGSTQAVAPEKFGRMIFG